MRRKNPRGWDNYYREYSPPQKGAGWGTLLILIIILLFLISTLLGFFMAFLSRLTLLGTLLAYMPAQNLITETNIIVLGEDSTRGIHRSDTIMIVHIDPVQRSAGILSIPRDTLVAVPGWGLDKINHAFARGGAELSRLTASNFLRIPIPYYVRVNLGGLASMVDRLGGITLNVEKRMYYVDYAGGLFVDLKPGVQSLSGRDALGYVRFRQDHAGDFGRIERQHKFLQAIADKIVTGGNFLKAPLLFWDLASHLDTNLKSREILGLSLALKQAYEKGRIHMTTVPGSSTVIDGVYYFRPDTEATQKIVNQFLKQGALGKNLSLITR